MRIDNRESKPAWPRHGGSGHGRQAVGRVRTLRTDDNLERGERTKGRYLALGPQRLRSGLSLRTNSSAIMATSNKIEPVPNVGTAVAAGVAVT